MTTQEFVKHEVDKISKESTLHGAKLFSDGLTKGLEIAADFADWLPNNRWKYTIAKATFLTNSELLTIFLTEKYGK